MTHDYEAGWSSAADEAVWPSGSGPAGPNVTDNTTVRWQQDGHCRDMDPEIFFAQGRGNLGAIQYAKDLCNNHCPVRDECLEYAMANNIDHGVWGGKSTNQRNQLRRERREAEEATEAENRVSMAA